jgi:putative heme-binding domain-containing protein
MPVVRVILLIFLSSIAFGAEVLPHRQDVPPNDPRSPQEALKFMKVPEGFSVELVAAEPDIVNPIGMHFDDRGRIWITESLEYPRKPAGPGRDRVKILEDHDGDGRCEKITTFADDLNIPTGVTTGHGGVWVLNAPDLLFFREESGKPISREVVLTGFGRTDTHELPNSLTWGPDGWLYGLNGVFNECQITNKGNVFKFNCALWRFHPVTREFRLVSEGTSNPYGFAWDFEGSAIVEACHWANDHLFHFVDGGHYQRQAGAFPPYVTKIGSITDHGHQKTAYCGLTMFDSAAYPEKYRGLIYVGNIHGGCINVDRLHRDGSTYRATAEPDFLSANDAWFMPVALKVGPDGCMYVLDWYDRYHCSQDAARDAPGVDRLKGRLYRIRYKDTPRAPKFDLAKESDDQLITRLSSHNIFFREAAQRNLNERLHRGNPKLAESLQKLALNPQAPRQTRLHAFWSLFGGHQFAPEFLMQVLNDADPAMRAWAVRASCYTQTFPEELPRKIAELARDPSPDVQLQIVIASRRLFGFDPLEGIVNTVAHCGVDKLIPAIAWNNLHPLLEWQGDQFVRLIRKHDFDLAPGLATLAPLAVDRLLGATNFQPRVVHSLVELLIERDAPRAKEALAAISKRVSEFDPTKTATLRAELKPTCRRLLADEKNPLFWSAQLLAARLGLRAGDAAAVRERFRSKDQPDDVRLQALESMIAFRDESVLTALPDVLTNSSPAFGRRVLNLLGRVENRRVAEVILAQYTKLDPELRPLALELLLQREFWARQLLTAVREKRVPITLNANQLRKILESNDREAIWEVGKIYGKVREERNPEREKVVAKMTQKLRDTQGDPIAGRAVFRKTCSQCHTIYGEGGNVGPDLTANGRASFEQLVSNVFDPTLAIAPAYQVTTVVTLDGRNLTGLVTEDGPQRVVLKLPGEGVETISRGNIKYAHLSKLSMMPEGLESMLDPKDLADLFAFLALDRPPDDPATKRIPGAGKSKTNGAMRIERRDKEMIVRFGDVELLRFVTDTKERPYMHPVHDSSGSVTLTDNRPADHPWQHGIFTGFRGNINGHEYWLEKDGRQHFETSRDVTEHADKVSWTAVTTFVAPDGSKPLTEENEITVHAPDGDRYVIDFKLRLKANDREVVFDKYPVGGLAVRMPWDEKNPRHAHLNSNGHRGRQCEKQRAKWCNVERPFGDQTYGIAVFDHPQNSDHPAAWRVDEQGLINPCVTAMNGFTLTANGSREYRYHLIVYKGSATATVLDQAFETFSKN